MRRGNNEITRLLLQYNPDLTIRDVYGLQAIHYSVLNKVGLFIPLTSRTETCSTFFARNYTFPSRSGRYVSSFPSPQNHHQSLLLEVNSTIPQYDFSRNLYYLTRSGQRIESPDVSTFFPHRLPASGLCLYRGQLVRTPLPPLQLSLPFCRDCGRYTAPRAHHCRECDM